MRKTTKRLLLALATVTTLLSGCGGGGGGGSDQSVDNRAPIASIDEATYAYVGEDISLQGDAEDPDGDALQYTWSIIASPEGSTPKLDGANSQTATFSADFSGEYTLKLVVSDGLLTAKDVTTSVNLSFNPDGDIKGLLHHIALTLGMEYQLSNGTDGTFHSYFLEYFECNQLQRITFYIGSTAIGEHACTEEIWLADLEKDGKALTERELLNISWLLQILDSDQKFTGSEGNGVGLDLNVTVVEGVSFNFDVPNEDFIELNNIRALVRDSLDTYSLLGDSFFGWDSLTQEQKIDSIVSSLDKVKLNYYAYARNWKAPVHSAATDIEQGFPFSLNKPDIGVACLNGKAGSHHGVVVGDVAGDERLEIMVNAYPCGHLYVLDANGQLLSERIGSQGDDREWVSLLPTGDGKSRIVSQFGISDGYLNILYPFKDPDSTSSAFHMFPSAIVDVIDGDGPEIVVPLNQRDLTVYDQAGDPRYQMSCGRSCGQSLTTPVSGDFDKDGRPEFITLDTSAGDGLYVFEHDGVMKGGFPVNVGYRGAFPVVGDVDGDGEYEIVTTLAPLQGATIYIYDFSGGLKYTILPEKSIEQGGSIALGDIDGDDIPEIVLRTPTHIAVFAFNGSDFFMADGWPQRMNVLSGMDWNVIQPVIGDVNGDGIQDIVTLHAGDSVSSLLDDSGSLVAYDFHGNFLDGFPKDLSEMVLTGGALLTPAIADLDKDGRNEIIVAGYSDAKAPIVYVYDLGGSNHGKVTWGQFGKDAQRTNFLP